MERVDYQTLIIQDILNYSKRDELEITPWYQRRSVWKVAQKSYLINTLFEKKPIPALYIRHSIDMDTGKSIREIVDGQQRTRAIIEFCNNKFSARHPEHKSKTYFSKLTKTQQENFLVTSIPIGYLLGATNTDVIDIFGRINSVSKSLNAQEKRNARFSGEMKQFCLESSAALTDFWRIYSVFSATNISRMDEVEFLSDFVFNLLYGLSDYTSKRIDDMYSMFDDEFPQLNDIRDRLNFVFDTLKAIDPQKIKDTIFCRQPIFFSLIIAIDALKPPKEKIVIRAIEKIDEVFNDDSNASPERFEFLDACKASTQRISQRKVRDKFIRSYFEL